MRWLLVLAIATGVSFFEELLDFFLVIESLSQQKVAPGDRPDPANDVDGSQHLEESHDQLGLRPRSCVACAGADHRTAAWQDYVENADNVKHDTRQLGHLHDDIPQLCILRPIHSDCALSKLNSVKSHLVSSLLAVASSADVRLSFRYPTQNYLIDTSLVSVHLIIDQIYNISLIKS